MSDIANLQTYGARLNSAQVEEALSHVFMSNNELTKKNPDKRGTPVCLWGTHGIGKTQMVKSFAEDHDWPFAYCAPAQFEEMGDLHGIPETWDPTPEAPNSGDEVTVYRPPEWVPQIEPDPGKSGILLLDDFNRADIRILRGCMQLLQNFEMFSWALPPRWQIVCTANPEGGDYSVTPMDDAMLTRMLHMTMVFDAKSWARWAVNAGVDGHV